MNSDTLVDLYRKYAQQDSEQFFVRGEKGGSTVDLSFLEFSELVSHFIGGLGDAGIKRGVRVALILNTSIDYVALIWAIVLRGCTVIPLPPPAHDASSEEFDSHLGTILQVAAPALVVTEGDVAIQVGDAQFRNLASLCGAFPVNVEDLGGEVCPDDIAVIQFTSGSTGQPKGCALSHRAVASNVQAIRDRLPFEKGDVLVSWLPLFHDMGLMSAVFLPVAARGALNLRSSSRFIMNPLVWLEDLARWPRSHTPVPNFAMALTLQKLATRGGGQFELSGVKSIVCGAEPIDANLVREFFATLRTSNLHAGAFHAAYGMAEGTLMFSSNPGGLASRHFAGYEYVSLGRPIPGAAARCVDSDGKQVPDGDTGQIQIKSPSLMSAYFNNHTETALKFVDGWMKTGDIGKIVDGNLFIFGRSDDMIIVGGRNIYPADIEAVVARAISISPTKVAVFGTKGEGAFPAINIVIEYRANEQAREAAKAAAITACIRTCGIAPTYFEFATRGGIPRTTSGKIRRSALRARSSATQMA